MVTDFANQLNLRMVQATPEQVRAIGAMTEGGSTTGSPPTARKLVGVVLVYAEGTSTTENTEAQRSLTTDGVTAEHARNAERGSMGGIAAELRELRRQVTEVRREFGAARELADAVVSEDVARQAFALVKALDSETGLRSAPVLTVFRLYCIEGLSADEVARRCRCSKGTVINRLEMIRRRTGSRPEKLRTYSAQFERVEESVKADEARRMGRREEARPNEDEEGEF